MSSVMDIKNAILEIYFNEVLKSLNNDSVASENGSYYQKVLTLNSK